MARDASFCYIILTCLEREEKLYPVVRKKVTLHGWDVRLLEALPMENVQLQKRLMLAAVTPIWLVKTVSDDKKTDEIWYFIFQEERSFCSPRKILRNSDGGSEERKTEVKNENV